MKTFLNKLHMGWRRWLQWRRWQKLASICGLILAVVSVFAYVWIFAGLPSLDNLKAGLALPSTRILDRNGRILYEILAPEGGRHTTVPLSQIPKPLVQATIATEDKNFYSTPGVDIEGIARALWINLQ